MSDIKGSIGKAAKAITKGSGALIKTTSLSIKLSSEEANLKSIYTDIGRAVHEIYKHGGSLGALFDEKFMLILETEAKIADLKTKLEIAKGTVTCSRCAATSKRGSAYCPKCGAELVEGSVRNEEFGVRSEEFGGADSLGAVGNSPQVQGTVPCVLRNTIAATGSE